MSTGTECDRRAPGATRIPFDAMVEVGGALGPSFKAQAINVSQEGMHLRTAYLPERGQPLTCRFDAGPNATVLATGEVVWTEEAGRGGEFGLRFTNLDAESVEALGGTRHTAGRRYSRDDPLATVIAVSDDGPVSVFRNGEVLGHSHSDD